MRASEEQIKKAILHSEEEVRTEAVSYWSDRESSDRTIMPLVIQAVERYGRDNSFRILRDAEDLAQTPATIDWLMAELRRDYHLEDVQQDNYRFAVALALVEADPELLLTRHKSIMQLPAFPEQLRQPLNDRLRFHLMEWPQLWDELERLGLRTMGSEQLTVADSRYCHRLIKAMGRHDQEGEKVIRALDRKFPEFKRDLMDWLEAEFVQLAGRMRLKQAIPRIIRKMHEGEDAVLDQVGTALGRIGTDVVVDEIAIEWDGCDGSDRVCFYEALEVIHTDRCIRTCVEFLADEDDFEIAIWLAQALLGHFCPEGIENACQLVLEDEAEELAPDQRDLKFRMVAVATAMEAGFPDYEEWHREALATNYGQDDYKPDRISEHF